MKKSRYIPLVMAALILATYAMADIIGSLPYNLTNGTTADATQVMANYQKIIDDTNANGAHNGANSDITALLGLTTPLGPTSGGTNVWYGGTSAGSANAQTVATLVPNSYTLTSGYSASFVAGFTNTADATLALNSTTAKHFYKPSAGGAVLLTGGEIVAGNIINVRYDGTGYQLQTEGRRQFGVQTDLASATTTDLGTIPSHNVNITSTTTITGFGSSAGTADPIYRLTFAGALTLTYNASSLIIPGATSILTTAGDTATAAYLGSGNWRIVNYTRASVPPGTGQLARVNVYVANDTWTRGTGEKSVIFECAGGGGAGGGGGDTGAGQVSLGGAGGAGGYGRLRVASAATSYTLTIGAAGAGSSAAAGGDGGNTTVGAVLTCNGGKGGTFTAPAVAVQAIGGVGGTATSGDLNISGAGGGTSWGIVSVPFTMVGTGGSNTLGNGGMSEATGGAGDLNGVVGTTCGGGGSGAASYSTAGTAHAGPNGGVGCVIAYTYY